MPYEQSLVQHVEAFKDVLYSDVSNLVIVHDQLVAVSAFPPIEHGGIGRAVGNVMLAKIV